MIALDTNILVYAHRQDSPHHDAALRAVTGMADGRAQWAIPWPCLHEFLAIVTHPSIYRPATQVAVAVDAVTSLLEVPTVQVLSEAADHGSVLAALLRDAGVTGPKVHDARVAAICLSHGVSELWSADRGLLVVPTTARGQPVADVDGSLTVPSDLVAIAAPAASGA